MDIGPISSRGCVNEILRSEVVTPVQKARHNGRVHKTRQRDKAIDSSAANSLDRVRLPENLRVELGLLTQVRIKTNSSRYYLFNVHIT